MAKVAHTNMVFNTPLPAVVGIVVGTVVGKVVVGIVVGGSGVVVVGGGGYVAPSTHRDCKKNWCEKN